MKTAVDIVNKAKRNAILLNDEYVDSRIVETNNRLMNKIIDEENGVTFWGKLTRSLRSMFVPKLSPELEVAILLLQNWSVFVCFQEQNSDCEISENLLCNFRAHESLIFDQYCESLGSNDRVLFNELIVPVYRAVKARMQNIATEESLNTDVLFKEVVAAVGWSSR